MGIENIVLQNIFYKWIRIMELEKSFHVFLPFPIIFFFLLSFPFLSISLLLFFSFSINFACLFLFSLFIFKAPIDSKTSKINLKNIFHNGYRILDIIYILLSFVNNS